MRKRISVIYLPGIGDHRPWGQDKIIKTWRLFGLDTSFVPVGWDDNESFNTKVQRLVKKIDKLTKNSDKIVIVGVSAGASAALNTYMLDKDKISAVVFICGKLRGSKDVNPRYYIRSPAFKESLLASEKNIQRLKTADRAKMLCLKSNHDGLVPARDSQIEGSVVKTIPAIGHLPSIFFAITFGVPTIAHFIRVKNHTK